MSAKKQEVTLYVNAEKWFGKYEIDVTTFDKTKHKAKGEVIIPLSEVTVEIELPDINEKQLQVEEIKQLQEEIQKEKADSYVRVTAIEERIQSLMALEHV